MTRKSRSSVEEFLDSLTPKEKAQHEKEYKEFAFNELILAFMEEDNVSVRKLAKMVGISPTTVQEFRTGKKQDISTKTFFKFVKVFGLNVNIERNGEVYPINIPINTKR